ncbi:hemin uptake protein HemP [Pseudotabrizicola algicola]|uniref:Hemin uptake protein HemP n=1 Tax=Pseudotabrizicola algicola TaxID=2709381 RepID=A0A6B3RH86_9RHOB|nr:hemin uptake protein HemP [Pseudotabrizicola algicola]NEX45404.1 hemin uptake protein HemP [Pseudotabrizicola algicola]
MQDTPPPAPPQPDLASAPLHEALSLTQGGQVAHIALDGQVYVLRITRGGKLILTK